MAYVIDKWVFSRSTEIEIKWCGKYGAKGEKRADREKATPEQIKKQNQRNKEKRLRRTIKANFKEEDVLATLKYPKGSKKSLKEVKQDVSKFLDKMRRYYKKRGQAFKFVCKIEFGKRGGAHVHVLINRIEGSPGTEQLTSRCWEQGRVNYRNTYEAGGFKELAEYMAKPPREGTEATTYSTSRNLIRPEPERKDYSHWTVRRLMTIGIEAAEGFYIDRDSVHVGTNKYTGMSYAQYTEIKLERKEDFEKRKYLPSDNHQWTKEAGWKRRVHPRDVNE